MLNFCHTKISQLFTNRLRNEKRDITFVASKRYGVWLQCLAHNQHIKST